MTRRTSITITVGRGRRPVRVEHRPLPAVPACRGRATPSLRKAAPAPRRAAPSTLAADVERILRDRSDFPRSLWGEIL